MPLSSNGFVNDSDQGEVEENVEDSNTQEEDYSEADSDPVEDEVEEQENNVDMVLDSLNDVGKNVLLLHPQQDPNQLQNNPPLEY